MAPRAEQARDSRTLYSGFDPAAVDAQIVAGRGGFDDQQGDLHRVHGISEHGGGGGRGRDFSRRDFLDICHIFGWSVAALVLGGCGTVTDEEQFAYQVERLRAELPRLFSNSEMIHDKTKPDTIWAALLELNDLYEGTADEEKTVQVALLSGTFQRLLALFDSPERDPQHIQRSPFSFALLHDASLFKLIHAIGQADDPVARNEVFHLLFDRRIPLNARVEHLLARGDASWKAPLDKLSTVTTRDDRETPAQIQIPVTNAQGELLFDGVDPLPRTLPLSHAKVMLGALFSSFVDNGQMTTFLSRFGLASGIIAPSSEEALAVQGLFEQAFFPIPTKDPTVFLDATKDELLVVSPSGKSQRLVLEAETASTLRARKYSFEDDRKTYIRPERIRWYISEEASKDKQSSLRCMILLEGGQYITIPIPGQPYAENSGAGAEFKKAFISNTIGTQSNVEKGWFSTSWITDVTERIHALRGWGIKHATRALETPLEALMRSLQLPSATAITSASDRIQQLGKEGVIPITGTYLTVINTETDPYGEGVRSVNIERRNGQKEILEIIPLEAGATIPIEGWSETINGKLYLKVATSLFGDSYYIELTSDTMKRLLLHADQSPLEIVMQNLPRVRQDSGNTTILHDDLLAFLSRTQKMDPQEYAYHITELIMRLLAAR